MGKIEAETCGVCKENPSKYRCPGCAIPYCSLACNKAHKAGGGAAVDGDNPTPPCTGKRTGAPLSDQNGSSSGGGQISPGRKRPRGGGEGGESVEESSSGAAEEGSAASATTACVRKGRDQWRGGREDREEEEWQMSSDQMKRMSGCGWLKAALRDPKLQGLLVSAQTILLCSSCCDAWETLSYGTSGMKKEDRLLLHERINNADPTVRIPNLLC